MANKRRSKRARKLGLPPGAVVHLGEQKSDRAYLTVFDFDKAGVTISEPESVEECLAYRDSGRVTWINIDGLHDTALIERLGAHYGVHPLSLEDAVSTGQRPKLDEFDEYFYVVLPMLKLEDSKIIDEQISVILGRQFVITLQERSGDVFNHVRDRIVNQQGKVRRNGADYLFYSLLDSIVDNYLVVVEHVGSEVEALDSELMEAPGEKMLDAIHLLKRRLLMLRRAIGPVREVTLTLEREQSELIDDSMRLYMEDVHDHVTLAVEYIDLYRELVTGMFDTYLSLLTQRTNDIVKVLTILAAIFVPLTFIAGIYGMNFRYMPELEWRYGYPAALLLMAGIAGVLLLYFRRRHWI